MKKDYPVISKGGVVPPSIPPPAPHGAALFYTARWHVWRVNGAPMLYERRPVKARLTEHDQPHLVHYDTVPVCPLMDICAADCGIDHATLADARQAVNEHARGLT